MNTETTKSYLDFVRYCIDEQQCIPSIKDWDALFLFMQQQALLGVGFRGLERMKRAGVDVPRDVVLRWYAISEQIRRRNVEMNKECARLTQLFESEGHHTAILKGQANARLYPDPLSRQSGDIDIWVDGGYDKVLSMLVRLDMVDSPNIRKYDKEGNAERNYYHIHLPANEREIDIEIHFRPSFGTWNHWTNKRIQQVLYKEISCKNESVDDGFRVPSMCFAIIMQLAHIQKHVFSIGIGFRQIMDYYYILKHRMEKGDTVEIPEKLLREVGLWNLAKAMMWVLHEVLGLEEKYMIAPMDEMRGKMLLEDIIRGGNFGQSSVQFHQKPLGRFFLGRIRHLKLLRFDSMETLGYELNYLQIQMEKMWERIKRRTWSLKIKML